MTLKNTKIILFASLIAAILLPTVGMSLAYAEENNNTSLEKIVKDYDLSKSDKDQLLKVMQNAIPITVEPTDKQLKMIEKIEQIKTNLKSESATDRSLVEKELDALKPEMLKVGIVFSDDFHKNMDYWKKELRVNETLKPIENMNDPSNGDYYTVHRLYFSCSLDLICNQGLKAYTDDYDWEYAQMTLVLNNGNHIHLEHEASNLHNHSVTRDFDSYWTHTRDTTILETDTEFTTQYFPDNQRKIQDNLLESHTAQTDDIIHSTFRLTP